MQNFTINPECPIQSLIPNSSSIIPANDPLIYPKQVSDDKLDKIAQVLNTAYDQILDVAKDDDFLQEHIEESLGMQLAAFITGLAHNAGYTIPI